MEFNLRIKSVVKLPLAALLASCNFYGNNSKISYNERASPTPCPVYSAVIQADSPVAYWKLDETAGTSAADSSGNSIAGAYTGGYTLGQSGPFPFQSGLSALFDGINGRINIPTNVALNVGNTVTVEAWIYPTDLNSRRPIFSTRTANAAGSFGFEVGNGNGPNGLNVTTPGVFNATANNTIAPNSWQHVVYTRDGVVAAGHQEFYVNGVSKALSVDAPVAFADNADNKEIGSMVVLPFYFVGRVGYVAVYNYKLSASQILNHYMCAISSI